jgi:CDGSH-type Zn-finger protein
MARASVRRSADQTVITPYRDGPLLVRGPVRIQDQGGDEIVVEREVVALCRCGKSRTRPLCDGTHKLIHFQAPSGLENGSRNGASVNGAAALGA